MLYLHLATKNVAKVFQSSTDRCLYTVDLGHKKALLTAINTMSSYVTLRDFFIACPSRRANPFSGADLQFARSDRT